MTVLIRTVKCRPLELLVWLCFFVATTANAGAGAGGGVQNVVETGSGNDFGLDARRASARQEVLELQRRYGQATDLINRSTPENRARCLAIYQRIFTPDAQIGVMGQLQVTGPEAWLDIVEKTQVTLQGSQHLIGSQVVDIAELPDSQGGGGSATMTSYLMASQIGEGGARTTILGTYVSEVVSSAEAGWQMSKMTLQLLAVDAQPPAPQ